MARIVQKKIFSTYNFSYMISIEYIDVYWRKFKKRLCCSPRFLVSLWNCCYVGGDPNRPIFMKWWIFPKRSSSFRNGSCKHKQRGVLRRAENYGSYSQKDATDWPFSPTILSSKLKKNPCRESIIIFGNQKKVWKWNRMFFFLYKLNWKSQYCCFITRYSRSSITVIPICM